MQLGCLTLPSIYAFIILSVMFVRLDVGDESASLFVLSVCADGSVAWYLGCPGCFVELRFLHCDDVRL